MRQLRTLAMATAMALASTSMIALVAPQLVFATCTDQHMTLYVDANGGGSGAQTWCYDSVGNIPNLGNIPGSCANGTWNDCISSVRVKLGQTWCIKTYSAANYVSLMATYWGAENEVLHNVAPDNAMSSIKQYQKSPPTPAGNC